MTWFTKARRALRRAGLRNGNPPGFRVLRARLQRVAARLLDLLLRSLDRTLYPPEGDRIRGVIAARLDVSGHGRPVLEIGRRFDVIAATGDARPNQGKLTGTRPFDRRGCRWRVAAGWWRDVSAGSWSKGGVELPPGRDARWSRFLMPPARIDPRRLSPRMRF